MQFNSVQDVVQGGVHLSVVQFNVVQFSVVQFSIV